MRAGRLAWLGHWLYEPKVAGSSPARPISHRFYLVNLQCSAVCSVRTALLGVLSDSSLSKYHTTFLFLPIASPPKGTQWDSLLYVWSLNGLTTQENSIFLTWKT